MSSNSDQELVCGLNTVNQIIISRPRSVQSLYVGEALNKRIESVVEEAEKNKIKITKKAVSYTHLTLPTIYSV